jgi:hypothetical protein
VAFSFLKGKKATCCLKLIIRDCSSGKRVLLLIAVPAFREGFLQKMDVFWPHNRKSLIVRLILG